MPISVLPEIPSDIRSYLMSTLGLTNVFIGDLMAVPVIQYAVFEYPGRFRGGLRSHGGDIRFDYANIQIMHRNTNPATAEANVNILANPATATSPGLDNLKDTTINSTLYKWINLIGRPRLLSKEQTGAVIWIVEFEVCSLRS